MLQNNDDFLVFIFQKYFQDLGRKNLYLKFLISRTYSAVNCFRLRKKKRKKEKAVFSWQLDKYHQKSYFHVVIWDKTANLSFDRTYNPFQLGLLWIFIWVFFSSTRKLPNEKNCSRHKIINGYKTKIFHLSSRSPYLIPTFGSFLEEGSDSST